MPKGLDRGAGVSTRFTENESSLQHSLRVTSQAGGIQARIRRVLRDRRLEICYQRLDVTEDAVAAGVTDRRTGVESFLHHGSGKAAEFGRQTLHQRNSQVDVCQYPVTRIR